jgi:hypothetical protein
MFAPSCCLQRLPSMTPDSIKREVTYRTQLHMC